MNSDEHARVTADEAAVEKRYNDALRENAKMLQRLTTRMTQNTWTTDTTVTAPRLGELIGRVALAGPNEILDGARDFYIGTAKHDDGDFHVYNWAAPIACTYYRKSSTHHEVCDDVIGVRVLAHRAGRLVDYQDEIVRDAPPAELFPKRQLQVPRAPSSRPRPPTATPAPEPMYGDSRQTSRVGPTHSKLIPDRLPGTVDSAPAEPVAVPGPALRAPDLLRRQLKSPKAAAMSAVLATLQSDQYEAITRPAAASQVLQGAPGTGKTIIAAHRAAYLLNSEAPAEARPRGQILILGPTDEYVDHVRGALRELVDDHGMYEVRSMPAVLEELAGLPQSSVPTASVLWEDVSPELARFVDLAFSRAKANLGDEKPNASDVYAELVWLLQEPPTNGLEGEWVKYFRALPASYEELRRKRISSYRGLMAYVGVRTTEVRHPGHVIVDEAQDVHPIEWEILGRLGSTGGWTILGDLNQRRTDHTFNSWDDVAQLLAIENDDGTAPVEFLERGYRSTSQIIRFANQLLPARDRGLYSLQQDGEAPIVERARSAQELPERAFSAATTLLDQVGAGTVAIITLDPRSITRLMTRRGWRADLGDPFTWRSEDHVLKLLEPARARGLEFDGVVVVEPADYPENAGRQGVLYTALTRANRLLTVVHHRALPRELKIRS